MKKNSIFSPLTRLKTNLSILLAWKKCKTFLFIIVFLSIGLWREKGRYWQIFRNTFIFKMSVIKKKKTLPRMHMHDTVTLSLFFFTSFSLSLYWACYPVFFVCFSSCYISFVSLYKTNAHCTMQSIFFLHYTQPQYFTHSSHTLSHCISSPHYSLTHLYPYFTHSSHSLTLSLHPITFCY